MSTKKRTFRIAFPVYAYGFDRIDLEESEVPETEEELKSKLLEKAYPPSLCHQCSREVELRDINPDDLSLIDVYEETDEEE